MSNKFKDIDIKNHKYYFFRWHDQYKKSWSKQNQDKWKVIKEFLFIKLDT